MALGLELERKVRGSEPLIATFRILGKDLRLSRQNDSYCTVSQLRVRASHTSCTGALTIEIPFVREAVSTRVLMGMTASLHKLTAGSGYDYLTRQVAAHDSTAQGRTSLATYYLDRGEAPGRWLGRGLAGLGDLAVSDVVTATQMEALFGSGFHPNMAARLATLPSGASKAMVEEASRLGRPFLVFTAATEFRLEVEARAVLWRAANDQPLDSPLPTDARAEIVNAVAAEHFAVRVGRVPSAFELSAEVARLSRAPTTACSGYDVTFTPVKSVSTLWAVAPL